jgi:molybdopterin synthase catalytic subunit
MVRLTSSPIRIQEVLESVRTPESGGTDIFVGTTRNQSKGRAVSTLEYEAYEPMALKIMERTVQEARHRWPLQKVSVVHRLGRVDVGEPSVVIAVSSAHRKEAFEACRFLIDRLKQDAPIWKREYFADGTVEWSGERRDRITVEKGEG